MGYTTEFKGRFNLNLPLEPEDAEFLRMLAATRAEARIVLKELLRWVDKMGWDSSMADASRSRQKR